MRILVTGANGFVGQALCRQLLAAGHEVRGAVRRTGAPLPDRVEPVMVGEIGRETDWAAALQGVEAVVHLAARVHVMHDSEADPMTVYRAVNTEGTLRLAQQAAASGVRRLVFVSSIKVNGEGREAPYTEVDRPEPADPYATSKWEAEQGLMQIAKETGLEVVILRPPLVYGPGVGANFRRLMQLVKQGIPLPFGLIKNRRSLIYLGNFVDAISLCLTHPHAAGKAFLACDGEDVSTPGLIKAIAAGMDKSARLLPIPTTMMRLLAMLVGKTPEAKRLLGSLALDCTRLRRELGWQPPYTLQDGIRETVSSFLKGA